MSPTFQMKTNNHCFTRDGTTYDCYAYNKSAQRSGGDGIRRWFVTARGSELPAFEFLGDELTDREAILLFENRVVNFVNSRLDE